MTTLSRGFPERRRFRGFWKQPGYYDYGDPWREQRYQGD